MYISCSRGLSRIVIAANSTIFSREQDGFRKSFSIYHRPHTYIHTLRQFYQKTEMYIRPKCIACMNYAKAFDSIESWTVVDSLWRCQIDCREWSETVEIRFSFVKSYYNEVDIKMYWLHSL